MTRLRITGAVGATAVAACLVAGAALAGQTVPPKPKTYAFAATYTGKAVVVVTDNVAKISSVTGVGTARAPVGKSKLTGAGLGAGGDPCGTFGGPGAITGVGGKLNFVIAPTGGSACGDESGTNFTVSGRATFKGGTAKYLKAKGTFKFSGTYNKTTGAFTVKFVGSLTA